MSPNPQVDEDCIQMVPSSSGKSMVLAALAVDDKVVEFAPEPNTNPEVAVEILNTWSTTTSPPENWNWSESLYNKEPVSPPAFEA